MPAEQTSEQVSKKQIAELPQKLRRGFVITEWGEPMYFPVGMATALSPEFQKEQRALMKDTTPQIVKEG